MTEEPVVLLKSENTASLDDVKDKTNSKVVEKKGSVDVRSYVQDECLHYFISVRHVGDHVGHVVL